MKGNHMKGKTISLLILFLLLLPTTQALTITMEGPTTLHGGSDHTYYINITSNEPTNISLTPHIHPNNTGFTTSFSEQSFIVQNTKNILFNITTNPYLIGTYNVSITYSSNIIKDNTPKQTKTITPSTPNIIEEPEEPEEPINKDNTTTPTEPSDNETDTSTKEPPSVMRVVTDGYNPSTMCASYTASWRYGQYNDIKVRFFADCVTNDSYDNYTEWINFSSNDTTVHALEANYDFTDTPNETFNIYFQLKYYNDTEGYVTIDYPADHFRTKQPEPYPTLYIAIAIIFIATIITLFYLYKRQEKEKRKK